MDLNQLSQYKTPPNFSSEDLGGQRPQTPPPAPITPASKHRWGLLGAFFVLALGVSAIAYFFLSDKYATEPVIPSYTPREIQNILKTYSNTQYGFEFQYSNRYILPEEITAGTQKPWISFFINPYSELKFNTIKEACDDMKRLNPGETACFNREDSREDANLEIKKLVDTPVGIVSSQENSLIEVVMTPGGKAMKSLSLSPQSDTWYVSFWIYTPKKDRIYISLGLPVSITTLEAAKASQQNKDLDQILSTFKFTK